jgi:F-type H+-transporting ATPase subunit a
MINKIFLLVAVVFSSFINSFVFASGADSAHAPVDVAAVIKHHIGDAHTIDIYENSHGAHISMPLPVILFTNQGLKVFMSSAFQSKVAHGPAYATVDGVTYVNLHEHIYQLNPGVSEVILDAEGHPTKESATHPLDFSITKNVFSMFLSVALLMLLFVPTAKKYSKNNGAPKGVQNLLEVLIVFVRDEIAKPNISEKKYMKYMPFLLTVFFFIWINNLLGLIPFFPGSANLTGNISFTIVMAVITYLVTTFSGSKDYWMHIFWMPGIPWPMRIMMAPIELIGTFTKPIALMIRLAANISAGHIIILSLVFSLGVVSFPMALFMNVLELLVAFLQAYVFTLLSALFIGQATEEHHHEEAHH